ncbi:hypothetical protein QL285_008217 [Trifolium repens]|nr:hypothetical protein QL285_008217 [Trifolium repens]
MPEIGPVHLHETGCHVGFGTFPPVTSITPEEAGDEVNFVHLRTLHGLQNSTHSLYPFSGLGWVVLPHEFWWTHMTELSERSTTTMMLRLRIIHMLLEHCHELLVLLSLLGLKFLVLVHHFRPHISVSITIHFWFFIYIPPWSTAATTPLFSKHYALTVMVKSS